MNPWPRGVSRAVLQAGSPSTPLLLPRQAPLAVEPGDGIDLALAENEDQLVGDDETLWQSEDGGLDSRREFNIFN